MSFKVINAQVLGTVIADAARQFATKDISEDQRVISAHSQLVHHRNYHAFVGRALSVHHFKLGIIEIQKSTRRGSLWQKV